MTFKLICAVISSIIAIISFLPYIKDIFRKQTKPHIYSWLVWSILQSTGVIAMFGAGARYGALGLAIGALFCIFIFFLSFKFGTKNITRFDTWCLLGAICAIIVWIVQKNPLFSVILITIIDFIGFVPTYRKSWVNPNSETAALYIMSATSNLFGIFAIAQYSVTSTLYVASLVLTNAVCVVILLFRRKRLKTIKLSPDYA